MNSEKRLSASVRVDPKSLATCYEFFDSMGYEPRNRSDLVHAAVWYLAQQLVKQGKATEYNSAEQALQFLAQKGIEFKQDKAGIMAILQKDINVEDSIIGEPDRIGEEYKEIARRMWEEDEGSITDEYIKSVEGREEKKEKKIDLPPKAEMIPENIRKKRE